MTFIEMILVSGIDCAHTQLNSQITSRKIKWCFVMRWQPLITYAKRIRLGVLFLMFAECKTPLRFNLCELISAGSSVTFITLDGKIRAARRYLCICDRMRARVLSDTKPHMRMRSKRLNVYTLRYDQPYSRPYHTASMHNVRMA